MKTATRRVAKGKQEHFMALSGKSPLLESYKRRLEE